PDVGASPRCAASSESQLSLTLGGLRPLWLQFLAGARWRKGGTGVRGATVGGPRTWPPQVAAARRHKAPRKQTAATPVACSAFQQWLNEPLLKRRRLCPFPAS